jgi:hypothetical protein
MLQFSDLGSAQKNGHLPAKESARFAALAA